MILKTAAALAVAALINLGAANATPPFNISNETLAAVANRLQTSPSDPKVSELINTIISQISGLQKHAKFITNYPDAAPLPGEIKEVKLPCPIQANIADELAEIKIIKHYRGDSGLPITPGYMKTSLSQEKAQAVKEAAQHFQESLRNAALELKNKAPLPPCSESLTFKKILIKNPEPQAAAIKMDLLFLRGPKVKDPDETFGRHVGIIPCTFERGDACSLAAERIGLTCLPTRLRISGAEIAQLEGVPALMNYEENKNGTLHPLIQAQLKKFLGGSP